MESEYSEVDRSESLWNKTYQWESSFPTLLFSFELESLAAAVSKLFSALKGYFALIVNEPSEVNFSAWFQKPQIAV